MATASVPKLPLAPGLLSMVNGWPSFFCKWSAIRRATTSGVEPGPNGATIVSVSIVDIPAGDGPRSVGHAPFDARALIASLDRLVATGVAPDANFEEGYARWKSAKGGSFTIGVLETLAVIRKTIEQHQPATQS